MTAPHEETVRLLAEARSGSGEALGRLLDGCRGYLLQIARQELDPDLSAKGGGSDIVQETFLEAQRDFGRFHGTSEDELLAWLRRLLLNNLANFRRRYRAAGKRQVGREVPLEADGSSDLGLAGGLAAHTPSPESDVLRQERGREVAAALARLPEDYRQVLLLRYQEQLGFPEIARRLGRSENAVQKLWARAVERMQREIGTPPDG
jgi:RNA polymerase sigma-70 factor (ECF subfamily)